MLAQLNRLNIFRLGGNLSNMLEQRDFGIGSTNSRPFSEATRTVVGVVPNDETK